VKLLTISKQEALSIIVKCLSKLKQNQTKNQTKKARLLDSKQKQLKNQSLAAMELKPQQL